MSSSPRATSARATAARRGPVRLTPTSSQVGRHAAMLGTRELGTRPRLLYRAADKQGSPPIDRPVTRDTPGPSIAAAAWEIIRPSSLSLVSLLPPHRRLSRQIEQMHYSYTLQYHLHSQTLGE